MKARPIFPWRTVLTALVALSGVALADDAREAAWLEDLLKLTAPAPDWREFLKRPDAPRELPPAADAAIESLVEYWKHAPIDDQPERPVADRLLAWIEAHPETATGLLRHIPTDVPAFHGRLKSIEDRLLARLKKERKWTDPAIEVNDWLTYHTRYHLQDLISYTRSAFLEKKGEAMEKDIQALARLDRTAASKLLLPLVSHRDSFVRTAALVWLHRFHHADSADARVPKWRAELQRIAENPAAPIRARDYAIVGLMRTRWLGQDEWFIRLFRDPALGAFQDKDMELHPLVVPVGEDRDRWIPQIVPMVGGSDRAAHTNAVRCLSGFVRNDAMEPLLPWLDDPGWADLNSKTPREQLVQSLWRVDLPACVPALQRIVEREDGEICASAASVLAHYKVTASAAAVRSAIEKEMPMEYSRTSIIQSAVALGAYSVDEMAAAVEAYVQQLSTTQGQDDLEEFDPLLGRTGVSIQVRLGGTLWRMPIDNSELVVRLLRRADEWEKSEPKSAERLRVMVANWPAPAATEAIVARLRSGEVTRPWVAQVLARRRELAEAVKGVEELRGISRGVQVSVTGAESELEAVLRSDDPLAKVTLLACARHIRLPLPVPIVEPMLDSTDAVLARAADAYLVSQDSAVARAAILRRHPGEARILGTSDGFDPSSDPAAMFAKEEADLRELLRSDDSLREIIALLSFGVWGNDGNQLVLFYRDKTVLKWLEGGGRRRERTLTSEESARFRGWIDTQRVDDLVEFDQQAADGIQYQYVRLTRDGGRRIYMNNPPGPVRFSGVFVSGQRDDPDPAIYGRLVQQFYALSDPPTRVTYDSFEGMAGFQIVHAREQGKASKLLFEKGKLLVETWQGDYTAWHVMTANGINPVDAPTPIPFRDKKVGQYPEFLAEDFPIGPCAGPLAGKYVWKGSRRSDELEGLWVGAPGAKAQLFKRGGFWGRVVTPDGEWIVTNRSGEKDQATSGGVVRFRVRDRSEYPVTDPSAKQCAPLTWLPSHDKVLLYGPHAEPPEYFLLDAVSGAVAAVTGEFRPFLDEIWQKLQPTAKPHEAWAALPMLQFDRPGTTIGRYDTREFKFHPALTVFGVQFKSLDMWVDEKAQTVTFIANGDVLRLALPSIGH